MALLRVMVRIGAPVQAGCQLKYETGIPIHRTGGVVIEVRGTDDTRDGASAVIRGDQFRADHGR